MAEKPIDLGAAREAKQLKDYHTGLMSGMRDTAQRYHEVLQKARAAGHFDGLEVGKRFMGNNAPFRIDGHLMRLWRGDTTGYWKRLGARPSIIEHEGKQYIPMLRVSSGVEGKDPEWSQSDAYADAVRHLGYKEMGVRRKRGGAVEKALKIVKDRK